MSSSLTRKAKCEGVDGYVSVKDDAITWFPDKPGSQTRKKIDVSQITQVKKTPDGTSRAMIRIEHRNGKLTLEFVTKTGRADFSERLAVDDAVQSLRKSYKQKQIEEAERVKAEQDAKLAPAAPAPAPAAPVGPVVPLEGNLSAEEYKRRMEVLNKRSDINQLHKKLVGQGLVQDSKFWEFIRYRLEDDDPVKAQASVKRKEVKRGFPTSWEDPTSTTAESSGTGHRFVLTAARRNKIFAQHPNIELAFKDNVPKKMTSEEFWEKYSKSRYFHSSRGGTATEADKLFALYDAQAPTQIEEELRNRKAGLTTTLDLEKADDHRIVHVQNVHQEGSSNIKNDMYLPKLQQLNRHGKLVLDSNASSKPSDIAWSADEDDLRHPLPDLEEDRAPPMIPLKIKNRMLFFEGLGAQSSTSEPSVRKHGLEEMSDRVSSWRPDLERFAKPIPASMTIYKEVFGLSDSAKLNSR